MKRKYIFFEKQIISNMLCLKINFRKIKIKSFFKKYFFSITLGFTLVFLFVFFNLSIKNTQLANDNDSFYLSSSKNELLQQS